MFNSKSRIRQKQTKFAKNRFFSIVYRKTNTLLSIKIDRYSIAYLLLILEHYL